MNPEHFEPPFITEEMASLAVTCSNCSIRARPDFWKRHEEPFEWIPSIHPSANGGAWRQVGVGVSCVCGAINNLPLKVTDLQNNLYLFGDEAFRGDEASRLFVGVYSLIGSTSGPVRDIENQLKQVKRDIAPTKEPDSWTIHVAQMVSGQQRLKHPQYRDFSRDAVEILFVKCADLISQLGHWGWNRCITTIYQIGNHPKHERKKIRRFLNRGLFLGLAGEAIHSATAQSLYPHLTFDAQSSSAPARGEEGWANAAFYGSRHYLGHLFITHSNDVPPPKFVQPGSQPLLELADVHAFHVARTIWQRAHGQEPDRGIRQFGEFRYLSFRGDRMLTHIGTDLPTSFTR